MILGTGCLADAALDGEGIRRALEELGLDRVLLSAREGLRPRDLGDLDAVGVRTPWDQRGLAISVARAAGTARIVVDLPHDAGVEGACRALHGLARSEPGLQLAVVTPEAGELAAPDALELVLDDLAGLGLAYWHAPARVHLAGQEDGAWCDRLARRLEGAVLDDVADGAGGLPPGTGELEWPRLAEQLRGAHLAVDIEPLPQLALLRMALQDLRRLGL